MAGGSSFDLLLRGGTVVDGTGRPAFTADVGIRAGEIVDVGHDLGTPASRVLDADGLIVSPGFIDIHTHYDAQVVWDPSLTSSCQYGVTTVITGNCGIGVAPIRAGDEAYLMQLLASVEGMSVKALDAGLRWDWRSFAEYLQRIDVPLGPNLVSLVGHSPLRYSVMGTAAFEREATDAEISEMRARLGESLEAGAWGFSSSFAATHNDQAGRPAPSRLASRDELLELAGVVGRFPFGVIGISPESKLRGLTSEDRETLTQLSVVGGASVNWNPMVYTTAIPDLWETNLSASTEAAEAGADVFAVWNPASNGGSRVDLKTCFLFMALPHWREVATGPLSTKIRGFSDPDTRRKLADDLEHDQSLGALTARLRTMWDILRVTQSGAAGNQQYVGRTVAEIATETGRTPLDTMLDIAVADDLDTVFMQEDARAETTGQREAFSELARSPYVLFGGTDAGAHLDMLCNESLYARAIQRRVVEEGTLSLEEMIRRFTSALADAIGLRGRGRIRPGRAADLVVFDLASIGADNAHLVADLPGGCERLATKACGVHHVIVNGEVLLTDGQPTGARPGRLLRSGADATTRSQPR